MIFSKVEFGFLFAIGQISQAWQKFARAQVKELNF
jgi:hypothetical protein